MSKPPAVVMAWESVLSRMCRIGTAPRVGLPRREPQPTTAAPHAGKTPEHN